MKKVYLSLTMATAILSVATVAAQESSVWVIGSVESVERMEQYNVFKDAPTLPEELAKIGAISPTERGMAILSIRVQLKNVSGNQIPYFGPEERPGQKNPTAAVLTDSTGTICKPRAQLGAISMDYVSGRVFNTGRVPTRGEFSWFVLIFEVPANSESFKLTIGQASANVQLLSKKMNEMGASAWTVTGAVATPLAAVSGSEGKLEAEPGGRLLEIVAAIDSTGTRPPSIALVDVNLTGWITGEGLAVSQRSGATGVGIKDNTGTCSYLFPHIRVRGVSTRLEDAAGNGFELKKGAESEPAVVTLLKRPAQLCLVFQIPATALRTVTLRLGQNNFTIAVGGGRRR